jgi:hypothetical protein
MITRQGLGSVHGFLSGEFGLHFVLKRFGKRLVDWTGSANQTALLRDNPGNLATFPEADLGTVCPTSLAPRGAEA